MFNNVMHLEFDGGPTYLDRVALSKILENFPCLNTLEFPEVALHAIVFTVVLLFHIVLMLFCDG